MDLPAVGVKNGEHRQGKVNILLGVTGFLLAANLPMALGCLQHNTLGKKGSSWAIRRTQGTE